MAKYLFCAFNNNFIQHAAPLIISYQHFHPDGKVIALTVNCDQKYIDPLNIDHQINVKTARVKRMMGYMCVKRWAVLSGFLNNHQEDQKILCLDADSIIQGPCDILYDMLDRHEMVSNIANRRSKKNRFLGGTVVVRNTPTVRKFYDIIVKRYKDMKKKKLKLIKWTDQILLWKAWLKTRYSKSNKLRWKHWPPSGVPIKVYGGTSRIINKNVAMRREWMMQRSKELADLATGLEDYRDTSK